MPIQKNRLRTKFGRRAQRHRRLNSEFTRLVAGGGNHAALVGPAAYDYRFAAQLRPLEQFHGNKERVHVHMQNGGFRGERKRRRVVTFRTKSSQVRHGNRLFLFRVLFALRRGVQEGSKALLDARRVRWNRSKSVQGKGSAYAVQERQRNRNCEQE